MLAFLNTIVHGILGFLNSFLPNSPFADILQGSDSLALGLGWLNWFFPVGDCLVIFGLFLGALVVWICVRLGLGKFTDISEKLV